MNVHFNKLSRVLLLFLVLTPAFGQTTNKEQAKPTVKRQVTLCLDKKWLYDNADRNPIGATLYDLLDQQTLDVSSINCSWPWGATLDYTVDLKQFVMALVDGVKWYNTTESDAQKVGAMGNLTMFRLVPGFLFKEVRISKDFGNHAGSITLSRKVKENKKLTQLIRDKQGAWNTAEQKQLTAGHTLESTITAKYDYKDFVGIKLSLTGTQSAVGFPSRSEASGGITYKGDKLPCDLGLDINFKQDSNEKKMKFAGVDITVAKRDNQPIRLLEEATITYVHSNDALATVEGFTSSLGLKVKFGEFQLNQFAFFRKNLSGMREVLDWNHQLSFQVTADPKTGEAREGNIEWEVGFSKTLKGSLFFEREANGEDGEVQYNLGIKVKYTL